MKHTKKKTGFQREKAKRDQPMKGKSISKRVWQRQQRATSGSKDDDPLEVFEVQSLIQNFYLFIS